jgi:hypothetical protein
MDIARLESLRHDFTTYTLGLLWLLALAFLYFDGEDLHRAARVLDSLALETAHVQVPVFAVGFLLVVLGVLFPYCMAQVFQPVSLAVLNACLWVHPRVVTPEETLDQPALDAIKKSLGHDVSVARDQGEIFLEGFLPRLAKSRARAEQLNSFRCEALLPASLLTAALAMRVSAAHLPSPWHWILGTAIGLLVFLPGIQTAINQLIEETRARNVAVLVAAKDATKAPQ